MALGTPGQPIFGAAPQNPGAVLAQVDQLRLAGRLADAERLCRSLVEGQPNLPNALNVLGLLVRARGDYVEAESLMRRAIAAAPREPALHNNLGNILYARGDQAGAESAYRKAIALKADYPDAYYHLGLVLREQGRSEEALAAQRRALALRPAYIQAQVQIGAILGETGAAADALALLDGAAAAAPGYYDAHYYRGIALSALERHAEAIPVLQAAVALAPGRHEARYVLAKAFAQAGRESDALLAYQRTFEAAPDFLPALYDFTALAWSMGNDVRSLQSYAYARGKIGDTPDLLLAEANLRMRFTDSIEAEALLRLARNKAPERADIANALGRALVLQTRLDESFPLFQEAIAAEPGSVRHRQDFGEALLKRGESGEALRVLDEALALAPHDQITLAYLALAARERGDSRYDALIDPSFVREYEIAPPPGFSDVAAFNRALAEELERLHTRKIAPLDQTLNNGTQTAGSLFTQKSRAIEAVREQIRAAVADYIASLPGDAAHPLLARKSADFAFAGSWSCRLRPSGFHTNHVHDQGWISSAYYVALPDEIAVGGQGGLKFGESKFRLGERDRPGRVIQPAVGKLVLFPSYFWHGTVPFQAADNRLAIAFDVVPGTPDGKRS
ncbi:MAG TPA: tetratricopeptide repeat protein [Rhizomicrobium sp.]|jgi:tetratricopeptide (TPR) repeat protein|nr:tetratricopeptide repeat protein [Rhizomicrobium sp.]